MASNLRHSSESRRNHVENQMGLESSEEGIGSNIATKIKKENLLLANYPHFNPPLEEVKNVAIVFSIYFGNSMLKNDTRELAKNVTTA